MTFTSQPNLVGDDWELWVSTVNTGVVLLPWPCKKSGSQCSAPIGVCTAVCAGWSWELSKLCAHMNCVCFPSRVCFSSFPKLVTLTFLCLLL